MKEVNYVVHRRQFYIGPDKRLAVEGWVSHIISNNLVLSHCPTLPVKIIADKNGNEWILIGDAIQSIYSKLSPVEHLQRFEGGNMEEIYQSWVGRWLLIGCNEVHLDALGLLGCYYKFSNDAIQLSSHPGLISNNSNPDYQIKKLGGAIEWFPLPDSGYNSISKLLPSQILDVKTGSTRFRNLTFKLPQLSYDLTIDFIASLLKTTLFNASNYFNKKLLLAVTAGYDSRLIMSVLNNLELPYEGLTFDFPQINSYDIDIPKKLSAISKVRHYIIRRGALKQENATKYDVHSSFHAIERDREFLQYQQFDAISGKDYVLLRGGGFEVGRCFYVHQLPKELHGIDAISDRMKCSEFQVNSLSKWINWVQQTPEIKMDWRDRFYWEQRCAGWLASTEQALDIIDIERFVPSNSILLLNLLLSIPEDKRANSTHHVDIIKKLSPELLRVSFNPKPTYLKRIYRRFIKRFKRQS